MKITKFKRALSVLLVAVMIISTLPLNAMGLDEMERSTRPADSTNNIFEDLFWELIKPFIKPKVTVKGLPENAEGGIEIVTDPFSSKAKSSLGTFLDFYDIKAKDKTTGEIVHPEGEVEVTIKDARIKQNQSVFLIHVLDDENVIKNADNVTLVTEAAFVSAFKDAAKAAENALGVSGAVAVEFINDLQISGRDITFKTSSFSIFAIVDNPILTVNFYKGAKSDANKIVSIRVKKADAADAAEFAKIIYDPGIDHTDDDENDIIFRGWFLNNNYTVDDATRVPATGEYQSGAMTIVDVRNKIEEVLNAEGFNGGELDFFAMLYKQFTVTYFDEAGNVCLGRDYVMQRADGAANQLDYQVTLNYVPYGQFENFEGWKLKSGDKYQTDDNFYTDAKANMVGVYTTEPDGTPDITGTAAQEYLFTTPTWTRISGDIYLYAYSPEGNWLVFDENGKGGTYIAPQFVKKGENTLDPNNTTNADLGYPITMQRYGYRFGGWYDTKAHADAHAADPSDETGKFTFGGTLSDNITIYASWIPNATANYTVLIWKQNVKGDGYDFAESVTITGSVGTIISTVTEIGTGNNAYATVNGSRKQWTGFHLKEYDQNVKILPEGTSILNVYYDRNVVTLTFQIRNNSTNAYVATTDTTGELYGKVDGNYVSIFSNDGGITWYTTAGSDYVETEELVEPLYALVDGDHILLTKVGDTWYYTDHDHYDANTVGDIKYGLINGQYIPLTYRDGKYYYISGTEYTYTPVTSNNGTQYGFVNGEYVQINRVGYPGNRYWAYEDYVENDDNGYGASERYALVNGEYVRLESVDEGGYYNYEYHYYLNGVEYTGTRYELTDVRYDGTRYRRTETDVESEYTGTLYTHSIPYSGPFYKLEATEYKGERFKLGSASNGWLTVHQFQGLYGSTLASNGYTWPTDYWWYDGYSNYGGYSGSGTRTTFLDAFILSSGGSEETFYGFTGTGSNTIRFYKQNSDGSWPTTPTNLVKSGNGTFYISDKYNGYKAVSYSTNGTSWTTLGDKDNNGYYGSVSNYTNLYIRFEPLKYNILYMDGQYVDGNNNPVTGYSSRGKLGEANNINYDSNLSSYNKGGANYFKPTDFAGFVFEGWYLDDACTHPYTFTTMSEGITVYAKWRQVQYRVFLHPNAGSANDVVNGEPKDTRDQSLNWGSDSQSMNFRVSYGGTISVPTGLRDEYVFAGWYLDPACTKSFIPATVLNDQAGTKPYDKTTDMTDVMDKWGDLTGDAAHNNQPWNSDITGNNGSDRFWITEKLDLYAKWRKKIVGADGMYVVYDTTDPDIDNVSSTVDSDTGTFDGNSPYSNKYLYNPAPAEGENPGKYSALNQFYCDGDLYVDNAFSYGLAACDAPANHDPELHFAYWVVQEWDASLNNGQGGFTDSDRIIYPGERFVTYFEYALRVDVPITDPTYNRETGAPEGAPEYDPNRPEHYYDYYMVIRAEYTEAKPQKTIVTYDANGGTWNDANMSSEKPNNNITGYTKDATANTYGFEINVNEEFDILVNDTANVSNSVLTRPGYRFKGWSFYDDNDQSKIAYKGDGTDDVVAADNLDRPDNNEYTDDDNNVLYAVWEEIPVYDLTINKTVQYSGLTVNEAATFNFTVTVTYPSDYQAGRETDAPEGANAAEITVPAGQTTGSTTVENIPEGSTVTVAETAIGSYTTTVAPQTIENISADSVVDVTNTLKTVDITVTKTISSPFNESEKTFPFTVQAFVGDLQIGLKSGESSFSLGNGGSKTVTVPEGARVVVTETTDSAYTCNYTDGVYEIASAAAGSVAAFTNTRKTATVKVTKTVVGLDADKNVDFTFNATSTSGSDIINGGQFTLKDGESQTITVPAGAAVTVTETANSNFYTDVNNTENTNTYTTAALAADASETVAFTNTRKITVTAKKIVDDKGVSDSWNGYMFPITLSDGTNSEHDDLAHNGTMTITVRYGATVTVSEDTEDGQNGEKIKDVYVTTYSAESVTANADGIVMTVTNTRKVFTVKVTKLAEGDFDPDKEFEFTATGLTPTSFTLKNNGEKVFADVPYGTVISVTEAAGGNEYDTTRVVSGADDGDSITVKANVTIAYTNTIKTYPVVVEKTVVSLDPDDLDPAKKTFTITVSYTLPNGTTGSVEMNLGNGQKNTDEAINKPIVLPYGTTYEVTETQEPNFKTPAITPENGTVTGATNVSVKNERETVEIIIDKDVTYSGDQSTSFIFDVTAPGVSRTEEGENAVTATHGTNSETITVPKGSSVTITEKNPLPDSTVTSTAGSVTGNATITFTANGNTTVKYVNKRNPLTIKVTKVLKTNDAFTVTADSTMTFPVHIVYTKDDGTESDETYNLKAGEFKEFNDVQYGSTLLVEETLTGALATQFKTPVISNYATTVTADQENITVTNERDTSTITVTKTVTNEAAAADFANTGFIITPEITGVTLNPASLTLKHGDEKEIIVPKGFTLKLTETVVDKFTPSYKVGSAATATSGNVVSSISTDSDEKVEFINHRDPVKVTVKKIFTGTVAGDDALTFPVVVTYVDDTNGETSKTLDLKGGQSETIENVAYGSAVTVTETVDTNLFKDPVIESNIEKITEDGTITVTNERKTATITVKKTVVGPDAQFAFTATAKLGDKAVTLSDDDASFTLGNNGTKTITVPAGTKVTVTEGDYTANYFTDVNGTKDTREFISGALVADTNTNVTFTNTKKVKVTVKKSVSATDAELVGNDTFAVAVSGDGVARLADSDKNFSLTKDGSKVITVIYGKAFTVTETIGSNLTWKYEDPTYAGDSNVTGSGNTFTATADGTVTITNTLKEYQVTVKKTGTSTYPANHPFKFNVEGFTGVGITDGVTEITLGGSKTWTVKAGSKIDVTEQSDDYTASSTRSVTGSDIVDGKIFIKADTTITFDNTIKTQKVKITKVIDNSELAEAFRTVSDKDNTPFSITYVVKDANGREVRTVSTTITKGTDITVEGVPYGGSVTVTEAAQTLFDITYTNNGATVKDDSTVITITNKRKATSLTINKTVESSVDADKAATYNFTVTVDGVNRAVPAAVTVTNGEGSTTINGLPLGAKVTVKETVPQYMEVDHNDQVINELAATGNELNFKNTRPNIEIPVEKIVKSRVKADYTTYTFSYEYFVDDHKYEGTAAIEIAEPNNSGTTTISVPEGATAFKLTEDTVDANLTVTYSNNEIAGPITTSPAKVTVTNERPEIPVTIEKAVVSDIDDYSGYAFKFDYTVKFGNQTVESGTKTITGVGSNSEITVPKGADITVTEQTGVNYTTFNNAVFTVAQVFDTTYSNGMEAANTLTGVVAEGGKITVTNTRKLVEVTVKKVVNNKWNIASDLTKEFSFNFNSAKMYTGADYATVITSADSKKLAHNGEIKIKVPFGATFQATETEDPAFDTTVKNGSADAVKALSATTAQLTADGTVITFTNTRKTIKVKVQKYVNKFFDEDINETFHFEADGVGVYGESVWTLPTETFPLRDYEEHKEEYVFEVPYGSNIQVKEVNHTGFTSSATLDREDYNPRVVDYDQNMTNDPLTVDALVIIYNDRDRVTITVTKTVATDAKLKTVDEAINFPFTYSWTKNENFKRGETRFTLHHDQEAYTFTVPVGAAVNVNELTDTELTVYNNLKISDVFATVSKYGTTTDDQTVSFNANAATTVAFTNTHKNVNVNLVKSVNLEEDKNVNFEFTWSAVYGTVDFTTDNGKATRNHNTTATLLCTVPVGVTISVTEILPSEQGFVTPNIAYTTGAAGTVDGAVVTISNIKDDATITYTNNRQVFDITFGKKVVNGVANDNEFPFRFTYTDNGGEEHEVFISDNGSITIPKVPYGHTIVITEDVLNQLSAYGEFKVADIFATAIRGQSANCTVNGTVVTIDVKQAETITFENTHKTSDVTITKNVVSKNESDKQHEFPFNATAHAGDAYVIGSANEKDSFVLKHGNTQVYTVPYGFEFTVGETPDVRYNTSLTFDKVKETAHAKTFTVEKDSYEIAYLNERAQGDLKIVKTGVGETNDAFLFKVTKNNDTTFKPLFVTIHGNGSVYVMQLEAGDYKVEEVTDWSWRYDKQTEEITNEAEDAVKTDDMATIVGGESGDKAPTVTFTNEKNNKNWLGTECGSDNKYDPQLTAAVDPAAEQVAWDSKIRLAYASPADKFRDNKETA